MTAVITDRTIMRLFTVLAAVSLLLAAVPARAQDGAYTVTGVGVDVTAENAVKAREKAILDAPREAYRRLMQRLVPAAEQDRIPQPSDMELDALVRDVQVEQEKASSVRYIASFTVRFKPDAVRGVLESIDVPFVEDKRAPLVVLPVYVTEDRTLLWDDPNPWRQAWARYASDGLVPFVVPLGELADLMAVTAEQATAHDPVALKAIAERYGAADVLVAVATLSPGPDGSQVVDVETHGFGPTAPAGGSHHVDGRPGEAAEALFRSAAADVAAQLSETYKQKSVAGGGAAAGGPGGQVPALVPLNGMQDWLAVRDRLSRLPQVKRFEVISLNRHEAALMLHYAGEPAQLEAVLTQAGFELAPGAGGAWTLRPPADVGAAAPQ